MKKLNRGKSLAYIQRLKKAKETGIKQFRATATWQPNNPDAPKGKWELCF